MNPITQQLNDLLELDIRDLKALQVTLDQEKEALKTRITEEIHRASKTKESLIKTIETRAKQKAKLLATSGLGIKPGHVLQALKQLGDQNLITRWEKCTALMNDCKAQNEVNGKLISSSLSRTSKLMNIIRGQSNTPKLYGQQGHTQAVSNRQVLGKA